MIGFFRIWAINIKNNDPCKGHFLPTDPTRWPLQGQKHLTKLLQATSMFPIAEDLGVIPMFIPKTLNKLGICGIKVMRLQKDKNGYIAYNLYNPLSVTTISTHDKPLLGEWWKNSSKDRYTFCKFKKWELTNKPLTYNQRKEILRDSHHTSSLFHINLIQDYLSLYPEFSFDTPEEERINIPGSINAKNWSFKIRPYLEDIIKHKHFTEDIKQIIFE